MPVAGQGDRWHGASPGDNLTHHVEAAAVGQADVTDDQVEIARPGDLRRFGDRARRGDLVS